MKQYQNPIRLPEPETIGKENVWAKVGDPFVYRFNGRYYLLSLIHISEPTRP